MHTRKGCGELAKTDPHAAKAGRTAGEPARSTDSRLECCYLPTAASMDSRRGLVRQLRGAGLLWRVKSTLSPRHLETLEDGAWLARIIPTAGLSANTERR